MVIDKILELFSSGIDINSQNIIKINEPLYGAARRYFRSWENAVNSSGLDYNNIIKTTKWSKALIKENILELHENGIPLNPGNIRKINPSLLKYAYAMFGSWEKAIKEVGIDCEIFKYKRWNKEVVVNKLNERHNKGLPLNPKSIEDDELSLYLMARYYFGSLENAMEMAGLNYKDNLSKKLDWTKEEVIDQIVEMYHCGNMINQTLMKLERGSLINAARKFFGSWENAVKNAGLDYNLIRQDHLSASFYGRKFEELLEIILQELNLTYSKGYNKDIKPDFVLSDGKWIDAKLSEWTIHYCDTIEKYEPYCNEMDIVYLRGDKEKVTQLTDKTKMYSVYRLIQSLPDETKINYTKLLDQLYIDTCESCI